MHSSPFGDELRNAAIAPDGEPELMRELGLERAAREKPDGLARREHRNRGERWSRVEAWDERADGGLRKGSFLRHSQRADAHLFAREKLPGW